MIFEILILGGYGQFVWPAFIFRFFTCFCYYLVTKKQLTKYENIFSRNFKQQPVYKLQNIKLRKTSREVLSKN